MVLTDRFWSKVAVSSGCWLWTAAKTDGGYGSYTYKGKTILAHRFVYAAFKGEIPTGLQIDHLCSIRFCVNPAHLEAVTASENMKRSNAGALATERSRAKTHCPHGHAYDKDNTYLYRGVYRHCRMCAKRRWREWKLRKLKGAIE